MKTAFLLTAFAVTAIVSGGCATGPNPSLGSVSHPIGVQSKTGPRGGNTLGSYDVAQRAGVNGSTIAQNTATQVGLPSGAIGELPVPPTIVPTEISYTQR